MILFLDDQVIRWRTFYENNKESGQHLVWRETAAGAIKSLEENDGWEVVFLDNDLSEDHYADMETEHPDCGISVARWVVERKDKFTNTVFIAHTLNPVASEKIVEVLRDAGLQAYRMPFAWNMQCLKRKENV